MLTMILDSGSDGNVSDGICICTGSSDDEAGCTLGKSTRIRWNEIDINLDESSMNLCEQDHYNRMKKYRRACEKIKTWLPTHLTNSSTNWEALTMVSIVFFLSLSNF